jgi:hypothetical protein
MRSTVLVFTVFALVVPAAAAPFPEPGDRFLLDVRGPTHGSEAAFGRWDATPAAGNTWNLRVTCGVVDLRTGREAVMYRGRGAALRDPGGRMVAVYDAGGVRSGMGWAGGEPLHPRVVVHGQAPCPGGAGEISTGD